MHICPMVTGIVPHVGGPILPPCMVTVLTGSLPQARITDLCTCVGPPDVIVKGSATVLVGGLPTARVLDNCAHGGVIITGMWTVLIGDAGASGGGAGGGAAPAPTVPKNGPFDTQDEAARAALTEANPKSIADNLEHGGMIYQATDGKYYYTGPAKGTDAGFNPGDAPVPPGGTPVGDYHTHGDYSLQDPATGCAIRTSDPARDDYNSDNFSATDRSGIAADAAGKPGYKGYLGTPSGQFKAYDPATGTTSNL